MVLVYSVLKKVSSSLKSEIILFIIIINFNYPIFQGKNLNIGAYRYLARDDFSQLKYTF